MKKLRAKQLVQKPALSRRYQVQTTGLRTITALVVLREHVLKPLLASGAQPAHGTQTRALDPRRP